MYDVSPDGAISSTKVDLSLWVIRLSGSSTPGGKSVISNSAGGSPAEVIIRVKVKVRTLDIAPLRSESPPQKRSGMARVLKDLTVLPAHPHVHPQSEWAIPAFAFPAAAGTHLPTPEGWKAE